MNNITHAFDSANLDMFRTNVSMNWLELEKIIVAKVVEELFKNLGVEKYSIENTYMVHFTYRNLQSLLRLNERDKTVTIHYVGDAHNRKKKRYSFVKQIKRRLDYLASKNVSIEQSVLRDNPTLNTSSNIL